jgi:hypothetical protein
MHKVFGHKCYREYEVVPLTRVTSNQEQNAIQAWLNIDRESALIVGVYERTVRGDGQSACKDL